MRLGLLFVTLIGLVGCIPEAGFMSRRAHWDNHEFPLTVCASPYVAAEDDMHALDLTDRVIRQVNDRLGFKVYSMGTTDCEVVAVIGEPVDVNTTGAPDADGNTDPGGAADVNYVLTSGMRCSVHTFNTGTSELTFYTIEHELGHCLGLAHDDWDGSIMRRVQIPTPFESFPPWIDDHDRALLRDTYLTSQQ